MGFEVDAGDTAGQTLLIAAIFKNKQILVQALLAQAGIDINFPNSQERMALMYAINTTHQSILEQRLANDPLSEIQVKGS